MAKAIDDIISLDPAESFEFSGSEVIGNVYDKLMTYNLKNVSASSRPARPELDRRRTTARPIRSRCGRASSSTRASR